MFLFSPYVLQSVRYLEYDEGHIVKINLVPDNDLKVSLVTEVAQDALWADWPVYEIKCKTIIENES